MDKKSKKPKILLTHKLHDFAINELKKEYAVEIYSGNIPMPKFELIKKIKNKDGLVCFFFDKIDKEIIDHAKKLKVISIFAAGFDLVDVNYAYKKNILVGHVPEISSIATAELTFGLIIDLSRRISEGDKLIRNNEWNQIFGAYDYVGNGISGKTIGIIGLGNIGKELAKIAIAFNMKILYHNRNRLPKSEEDFLHGKYVSINTLLKKSDIVSILIPYTKMNHEIIDLEFLKKMKKSAILINTARGKLVKEKDLVIALEKKIISGAALDVFQNEPIEKNNKLKKMKNVVLTPHLGSCTEETRREMSKTVVKNLKLGLKGEKTIFSVFL